MDDLDEMNAAAPVPPLSDAWKAELDRREVEYEQGRAELVAGDEVFARVRAELRRT